MKISHLERAAAALTLFAAGLFCAQTAGAQTAADNAIKACYNVTNGQMRQVSGPSDCKNGETYILWNVQGPTVAVFPIGRAPEGNFAPVNNASLVVCGGPYLGQATIDPGWFGGSVDYRFVVYAARTSGGSGENLYFDFCIPGIEASSSTKLYTNVVFNNPHLSDSGWQTLSGSAPVTIILRARTDGGAAGNFGHAYILVRPHQ